MFQPEILQPMDLTSEYGFGFAPDFCSHDFSSRFSTPEASSDISFSIPFLADTFSDEYRDFQVHLDEPSVILSTNVFSPDLEELDSMFTGQIDGMLLYSKENEESLYFQEDDQWNNILSPSMNTSNIPISGYAPPTQAPPDKVWMEMTTSIQPSLNFPSEGNEIDNQLIILHLVMAYREALQNGQKELVEVIVKRISQTVSPVGEIMQRLLYYLFLYLDRQSDYLKVESKKNFHAAYHAFYQIYPYGKFAHFAANSAILEAMPNDADVIHIFDFELGDGVQWSSMIEAMGSQQGELKLTSIKWSEGDYCNFNPSEWKFEDTKRRLLDHARSFNLRLKVDEIEFHDFCEIKNLKKRGNVGEWCAFNCMVSLPHMGRVRSRKHVIEFLRVSKEFITCSNDKGIITFGDGDAWEKVKICSSFTSFFDGHLVHYQNLLESLECSFPIHLAEARTAMEFLFVAPFVSSNAWIQKWEEIKESRDLESEMFGLEGWKVSTESLMEAKEMVREGESLYGVRIEGEHSNQVLLDWRGNELVRVSCWQS